MIIASLAELCLGQPEWAEGYAALQNAKSLSAMVWNALQMGLIVARLLLEQTLAERAQEPVTWGDCAHCGTRLHSKGWQPRTMQTLVGKIG
jgi:hypothetical protein